MTIELAFSGTAGLTADYTRSGTSIIIPAGSPSGSITLTPVHDLIDESNETIVVDIDVITHGMEAGTQQVTAVITDDDEPPQVTLSVTGSPIAEASGQATVTATLSAVSGQVVTVTMAFSGTASAANDYTVSTDTITILPGATTGTLVLTALQDPVDEDDETIQVDVDVLANGTEAGSQTVMVTIADDDTLLIDDGDPLYTTTGTWTQHTTLGGYASADLTADLRSTGANSGAQSIYRFENLTPNTGYVLSTTWLEHSSRTTNATYMVTGAVGGSREFRINQQIAPNDFTVIDRRGTPILFENLGNLVADSSGVVTVTVLSSSSGTTVADAVKLTPITTEKIEVRQGLQAYRNDSTISLGNLLLGDQLPKRLTIINVGVTDLILQPVTTTGALSLSGSNFSPNQRVLPGQSVELPVQFDLTVLGSRSGTVTIPSSDPDLPSFVLTMNGAISSKLILDDGDANQYSTTGTWTNFSGLGGFAGQDGFDDVKESLANSGAQATYTFLNLVPDIAYQVSATWLPFSNRTAQAPYQISGIVGGPQTVTVNQLLSPAGAADMDNRGMLITFQPLGNYIVDADGVLRVTLTAATSGNTIADAIRVTPVPDLDVRRGSTSIFSGSPVSLGTRLLNDLVVETFTIMNTGDQTLTLQPATVTDSLTIRGTNISPNQQLAPGASTTIQIQMSSAVVGQRTGTVSIPSDDPLLPLFRMPVSALIADVLVVDDGETVGFQQSGSWTTWVGYGGYAGSNGIGDVRETLANTGATARYSFPVVTPGYTYEVAATWTQFSNRSTQSPYRIQGITGGPQTILVNQQVAPSGLSTRDTRNNLVSFRSLGTFTVESAENFEIQLSSATSGRVISDAILIRLVSTAGGLRTGSSDPYSMSGYNTSSALIDSSATTTPSVLSGTHTTASMGAGNVPIDGEGEASVQSATERSPENQFDATAVLALYADLAVPAGSSDARPKSSARVDLFADSRSGPLADWKAARDSVFRSFDETLHDNLFRFSSIPRQTFASANDLLPGLQPKASASELTHNMHVAESLLNSLIHPQRLVTRSSFELSRAELSSVQELELSGTSLVLSWLDASHPYVLVADPHDYYDKPLRASSTRLRMSRLDWEHVLTDLSHPAASLVATELQRRLFAQPQEAEPMVSVFPAARTPLEELFAAWDEDETDPK